MNNPLSKEKSKLIQIALRYLGFRDRSSGEIRTYLSQKTQNSELINQVITELIELGLVNDGVFAQALSSQYLNLKLKGPKIIDLKLKQAGLSLALRQQTLASIQIDDQIRSALILLEKKNRLFSKKTSLFQAKAKASQYLYSRGYQTDCIQTAIDEFFSDQ